MKPRTVLAGLVAAACALVLLGLLLRRNPPPLAPPPAVPSPAASPPAVAAAPPPADIVTLPVAEQAATLNSPGTDAAEDLATLELLLSQYRRTYAGNPVGENEEIAAALLGRNPKRLAWLPATGSFLDAQGRLIDRWGTPYFFHALAADRMEIRSAGPDRTLWTPDDLLREAL